MRETFSEPLLFGGLNNKKYIKGAHRCAAFLPLPILHSSFHLSAGGGVTKNKAQPHQAEGFASFFFFFFFFVGLFKRLKTTTIWQ